LLFMQAGAEHEGLEIGARRPATQEVEELAAGEVGYLIAGVRDVGEARSGETVTHVARPAGVALAGYSDPKPMVFCGLFPIDADDFEVLRESLQKLKLNDASISYLPESSGALGFGFRCGFLGLLHMEIVKERLEREFNLALIATAPSVQYRVLRTNGEIEQCDNPSDLPATVYIDEIEEPFFKVSIIAPKDYTGALMELCQQRRGEMIKLEYLSPERVEMQYLVPLAEVVVDFFDQMKSKSQGYASLDYELHGYRSSDLVRVDILLNAVPADAFSMIVHRERAPDYGRRMCAKLKVLIPRQMFDIPIQAAIGGKVISRETVKAKRKDVLARCYGGDITRKRKLLDKQKEGKKKMKSIGRVEVPGDVFITALKLDD
ncbi:MAG: elongation factor 4, partial [Acidimicrobiaceae bacterium]|nr:elongation factor 4 [Acidimicrobiaceae bacterium]